MTWMTRVLLLLFLSIPLFGQPSQCPTTIVGEPVDCSPPTPTAAPVAFNGDTGPMRVRKSAFELSATEVAELKLAFKKLRDIAANDPTDPRGWLLQANVHCWYCGGGQDFLSGPEIHGGYLFFPWHRTYLYTVEKILGELVGNPSFALPYWDWDTPGRDQLPPPYITPNDSTNSLYDARRGATPGLTMPDWTSVNGSAFQKVMDAPTWELFMGTPNSPDSSMGSLEGGPHGNVHIWTGDPSGDCALSDMGVLATAAQDPIFFAHHANIDRLWSVWLSTAATPAHTNPTATVNGNTVTDPNWLQQPWFYYNEDKVWYAITVADTIHPAGRLHYTYKPPTLPAAHAVMAMALPGAARVRNEPHTVSISSQPVAPPAPAPIRVLHIDGVLLPPGLTASIRVFINSPNATHATSNDDPNYVGQFTIVPHRGGTSGHAKKYNVAFHLTPEQAAQLGRSATLQVTLVPMSSSGRARNVNLTYDRIYITELPAR